MADDNTIAFDHTRAFLKFAYSIRNHRRFIWQEDQERFIAAVRSTCEMRLVVIKPPGHLWRAQAGYSWVEVPTIGGEQDQRRVPYPNDRMLPQRDRAKEGRANPQGIPVIYAALRKETAMSETRPWIGAYLSVAALKILRPLTVVDCTKKAHSDFGWLELPFDREPSEEEITTAVWTDIDAAFAQPVARSDDVADYAPTQVLAELFRGLGYDGVVYGSHFGGKSAFNAALFDHECVEVSKVELHVVTSAQFEFEQED